jgi:hypothetical protein
MRSTKQRKCTGDFACTCLVTEVLAPEPLGRIRVANHFPDYQLDHEREGRLQAVTAARVLESLVEDSPGHAIAGDMDADPISDSIRFWTGRHVIDDVSVCYRSAWEAAHPAEQVETYCGVAVELETHSRSGLSSSFPS